MQIGFHVEGAKPKKGQGFDQAATREPMAPRGPGRSSLSADDKKVRRQIAQQRTASIDLSNIRLADGYGIGSDFSNGAVFQGTDASGNIVKFRANASDARQLVQVMTGDLAGNFSGVTVDETDIVTQARRTVAASESDKAKIMAPGSREISYDEAERIVQAGNDGSGRSLFYAYWNGQIVGIKSAYYWDRYKDEAEFFWLGSDKGIWDMVSQARRRHAFVTVTQEFTGRATQQYVVRRFGKDFLTSFDTEAEAIAYAQSIGERVGTPDAGSGDWPFLSRRTAAFSEGDRVRVNDGDPTTYYIQRIWGADNEWASVRDLSGRNERKVWVDELAQVPDSEARRIASSDKWQESEWADDGYALYLDAVTADVYPAETMLPGKTGWDWDVKANSKGSEWPELFDTGHASTLEAAKRAAEKAAEQANDHYTRPGTAYDARETPGWESRLSRKETPMDRKTEAALLAEMPGATLDRQRQIAAQLDQIQRARHEARMAEREIDFGGAVVRNTLTPVVTAAFHTKESDWLDEAAGNPDVALVQRNMTAAASAWFSRTAPEVKADRDEYRIQAEGAATTLAGAHAPLIDVARSTFLRHALFLNRRTAADINPYPANEQAGYAETGLPPTVPVEGYDGAFDNFAPEVAPENQSAAAGEGERTPMPGAGEPVTDAVKAGMRSIDAPLWGFLTASQRAAQARTAADGQTCATCGDSIARDPEGESNRTWHHTNGTSHDHEAKPGSDSKEAARTHINWQQGVAPSGAEFFKANVDGYDIDVRALRDGEGEPGWWAWSVTGNGINGPRNKHGQAADRDEAEEIALGIVDNQSGFTMETSRRTAYRGPIVECMRCGAEWQGDPEDTCSNCGNTDDVDGIWFITDEWGTPLPLYDADADAERKQMGITGFRRTAANWTLTHSEPNWVTDDGDIATTPNGTIPMEYVAKVPEGELRVYNVIGGWLWQINGPNPNALPLVQFDGANGDPFGPRDGLDSADDAKEAVEKAYAEWSGRTASRRTAAEYGEMETCGTCGSDIQYLGDGWYDRGGNTYCDNSGQHPLIDGGDGGYGNYPHVKHDPGYTSHRDADTGTEIFQSRHVDARRRLAALDPNTSYALRDERTGVVVYTHVWGTEAEEIMAREPNLKAVPQMGAYTAGTDPQDQSGEAESALPIADDITEPFAPWELPADGAAPAIGQGAADVASVPTPGGESGYPQPTASRRTAGSAIVDGKYPIPCVAVRRGNRSPMAQYDYDAVAILSESYMEDVLRGGSLQSATDAALAYASSKSIPVVGPDGDYLMNPQALASRRTAGWSCTQAAGRVLDAWVKFCLEQSGQQNVFSTPRGQAFWETGREQADGSIVGSIYYMDGSRGGSFKIDADGNVVTAPAALKNVTARRRTAGGLDGFWESVDAGLAAARKAKSAQEVVAIFGGGSQGDGFFAGGDGDDLMDALFDAGWKSVQIDAPYLWCLQAPDGSMLTYVEGDLFLGNQMI